MNVFEDYRRTVQSAQPMGLRGCISGVRGLTAMVDDFPAPVGSACRIFRGGSEVEGRVVGFSGRTTLVMPMGAIAGLCRGDRVEFSHADQAISAGGGLLGRVIDSHGRPIDGRGPMAVEARVQMWPAARNAMERRRIDEPLATGVRAIDGLLTVGRGQRMGIFSGSGVGKSVLLGMIGRYTAADVTVIGLIGERGREVLDFIERDLGEQGLARSVVVVSTSDEPPLARVQAAAVATAVAEYFRVQGHSVLLLVESLTRLAAAQRMIGLAAGEPPATKGYTPSVFSLLPELLERPGRTARGSITAFYTVLVEGDDAADPVADAVRSITDGHIFLSRGLAAQGHYPAIDVLGSISRVMMDVAGEACLKAAREVHRVLAMHAEIQDLVNIGAYKAGASTEYDLAIAMMPAVRRFVTQAIGESSPLERTRKELRQLHQQVQDLRLGLHHPHGVKGGG